jgi:LysR family transcriptional regulator, transcriptional activator of nhaA
VSRLNYQHLYYYWTLVRSGSLARACEELDLAPATVSAQVRLLEEHLAEKLLQRKGRRLEPTESGRIVQRYAQQIFGLGQELQDTIARRAAGQPETLAIGVDDVLPKELVHRLLGPAVDLGPLHLRCLEGTLDRLVQHLIERRVDLVLADNPVTPGLERGVYSHLLGASGIVWMGTAALARRLVAGFPGSLNGQAVLLPTDDTAMRRAIDLWLSRNELSPVLAGEFEDYALLREFARAGRALAPVPTVLKRWFEREYGLVCVGPARGATIRYHAITLEARIRHPAVRAIRDAAQSFFQHERAARSLT